MIKDLLFMAKMIGLTVLVVLVMQFKIGEKTLDQNFHQWLADSVFVDYIQTSIDGGIALTRTGYNKMHAGVSSTLARLGKHHKKDERGISLNITRHSEKEESEEDAPLLPHAHSNSHSVH